MVAGRGTDPRTISLTSTNASTAVTAPAGTFSSADVGRTVTATGINAGITIASVQSATAATLSGNASASSTRSAVLGVGGESVYGYRGWSPESQAEADSQIQTANGTGDPNRFTDAVTSRQDHLRSRT
jgi:hypothetical protein